MSNSFKNVYNNRKVLLTGNTGFKGSWLTTWLLDLGAKVIGFSLDPPTEPNLFEILSLKNKISYIKGDVRDTDKFKNIFNEYQPEIVFHLAAQPLVRRSYQEPKLTYETNLMGTVNLFEAVRDCESVEVVINVTSDKCYENKEKNSGYDETDPLGGYDPYSSSKAGSELITASYRKSFFSDNNTAIASVRAGNVIGGGDWGQDRLIPDCIRALTTNELINIRNPQSVRPWQHVLEPLAGYLWLASLMWHDKTDYNQAWNFGPEKNSILNVEEVVKQIIRTWGQGEFIVNNDGQMPETNILKLDINKVKSKLNWKPIYNIDETLEKTVLWYLQYYNKQNILGFTLNQIRDYTSNAKKQCLAWAF